MRDTRLLEIPVPFVKIFAQICEQFPNPPMTRDTLAAALEDNILLDDNSLLTFADLNFKPQSLEEADVSFMKMYRRGGNFSAVRGYH